MITFRGTKVAKGRRREQGFTLIELVVVIVILGVLAATALPKFNGIQQSARIAILNGARGAVATAMNVATATQQAQRLASNVTITLDGVQISMVHAYPIAYGTGTSGIFGAAGLSTDFSIVSGSGGTTQGSTLTITVSNSPTPSTCSFVYTAANGATPPIVAAASTAGC